MSRNVVAVPASGRRVMDRAFTAGSVLVAGTVAVTGVFIAKISQSYAQTHTTRIAPTTNTGPVASNPGTGDQLSVPQDQQVQQPLGGSNGS